MGDFTAQELHFENFVLDRSRFRLQRGGRVVRLEKLPMELLILLAERGGELVSRDEIAERLWGKGKFLDIDHGINTAIRKIRVVLRDDPEKPRFVETVVGKGYRFAASVTSRDPVPAMPPTVAPAVSEIPSQAAAAPATTRRLRALLVAIGIGLVAVGVAISVLLIQARRKPASPAQTPITSLAVLPLKNLSGNPAQDYLADGMTEELISRLSNIPGLRVVSRTSAMHFKDSRQSVPEIAKALNVDAVLEGSVIREGSQVRVHAQLIRAATDTHIWAQEYQREFRSLLALEEEVARSIALQVNASVHGQQALRPVNPPSIDPEAHEAYLKGRYYWNQRTPASIEKSIGYYQQAIAKDPEYARAYCGLADAYALLGYRGHIALKDALAGAKTAALKAVQLDDTLAEAHASLGFIAETLEWDWSTAEREYKRAIELNPGLARAHHWYAGYLTYVGRFDEAIAEAKRARELDPLSLPVNNALAGRLLAAGQDDAAMLVLRDTLQMDPGFAPAHATLGWAYLQAGEQQPALSEFRQAVELSGNHDPDMLLDLGFAYAVTGERQKALEILKTLRQENARGLVPAGSIGILYGALGERDEAFAWLDKAVKEHDPELTYVKIGRRFMPLREDPRFGQLVQAVGLPD